MDVRAELVADHRELLQRRVEDVRFDARVAPRDQAQHGHEDEEQREQREKGVVHEEGGERSRPVVAELLDHRIEEGDRSVPLLEAVHSPREPLDP
jgi:hypothetical protein